MESLRSQVGESRRVFEANAAALKTLEVQFQGMTAFFADEVESIRPLLDQLRLATLSLPADSDITTLFKATISPAITAIIEWTQRRLANLQMSSSAEQTALRDSLFSEIAALRDSRACIEEDLGRMRTGLRALLPAVQNESDDFVVLLGSHIDSLNARNSEQGRLAGDERAELNERIAQLQREISEEKRLSADHAQAREGEFQAQLDELQRGIALATSERDSLRHTLEARGEEIRSLHDHLRGLERELEQHHSAAVTAEQRDSAASVRIRELEGEVEGLRNDAFTRMSRIRDLEGELHVLRASANSDISVAQSDIQQLTQAVTQLKQAKAELQQTVALLQKRIAEGEDQQNLRAKERSIALLKREVSTLQARLTDVRAEVSDSLKTRALDLEADLRAAQGAIERLTLSEKDARQQLAVLNSAMVGRLAVKDNIIQALESKIKVLEAADNVAQQYQREIGELKEQIVKLQEELQERANEVQEAKERINFLEITKADAKNQNLQRVEAQLEVEMKKVEALKQAAKEDALSLKELRTKTMHDQVAIAKLEEDLRAQVKETQHFQDMMQVILKSCTSITKSLAEALKLELDSLRVEVFENRESVAGAVDEWNGMCAQFVADLVKEIVKMQATIASIPAQLQAQEKALLEQREKLREGLEKRMEQIKAKLTRKDELLAGYDGDLEQMKEFKSKALAAENTIRNLNEENERLRKRVAEQRQAITEVEGRLEEQKQLCEALAKRKEVAQAFSQSLDRGQVAQGGVTTSSAANAPVSNSTARRQADELKEQLAQLKTENAQRIKQKNVLIMTLRRQLKSLSEKILANEAGLASGFDKSLLADMMSSEANMEESIPL